MGDVLRDFVQVEVPVIFGTKENNAEIHEIFKKKYGPDLMDICTVRKWTEVFKNGRISVVDEVRSGRPVTTATPDIISRGNRIIQEDRWVGIADRLNVSVGTNRLPHAIKVRRPEILSKGVILHYDNAWPHISSATTSEISKFGREMMDHPLP